MGGRHLTGQALNHLHDAGLVPTFPRIVLAKLLLEHRFDGIDDIVDRARLDDIVLCPTAVATTLAAFERAGLLPVLRPPS